MQQGFCKILVQCDHQIGTHFLVIPTSRISTELPIFQKSGSGTTALEKEILDFRMWFQRYDFLKDPPLHFMGEALGILYNQTFFCSGLE